MNAFESTIKKELDNRREKDTLLASNYPNNPKGKTITDCCNWIISEAQKHKSGNVGIIDDEAVYSMAVSYFIESVIEKYCGGAKARVAQSKEPTKVDEKKLQKALDKATTEIHKQTDPKIGTINKPTTLKVVEPKKMPTLSITKKLVIPSKVKKGSKRYNEIVNEQLQTTLF